MFNEKLLIEVLGWQSESRKEEEQIIPTLREYLKGIKGITVENDTHGNIFVTKGKADLYPCIVSHLDQVHKYAEDKRIIKNGDYLLAFNGPKQVGTGGDDLVGVFMCLSFLKSIDNIKVAFFVAEEVGCIGSSACDLNFFKDCMFIGQADRRDNADFINNSNGVSLFDEEFSTFVSDILKENNYSFKSGTSTDAGCLSKRNVGIACFNISCGYYGAHTSTEYVCISDVVRCHHIIESIIKKADKQFKYVRQDHTVSYIPNDDNKSEMYKMLYSAFVNSEYYVKSNKMSYAYSKAIQFVSDLLENTDRYMHETYDDFMFATDMISEYLFDLEEQKAKELESKRQTQLSLFTNCRHQNKRFDLTMQQSYCMDCFTYIDEDKDVPYRGRMYSGYDPYDNYGGYQ
jgi:tripeptide aminopeptidase